MKCQFQRPLSSNCSYTYQSRRALAFCETDLSAPIQVIPQPRQSPIQ